MTCFAILASHHDIRKRKKKKHKQTGENIRIQC